ncbi:MAG: hypothetical protein ACYC4F_01420 [Armatimonadota bacterium]
MQTRKDGFRDRLEHVEKLKRLAEESRRTGKPCPPMEERAVKPFADPVQNVIEFTTIMREYHHPFNYRNITHHCYCNDPSNSGLEINPINSVDGRTDGGVPGDYLEIVEDKPIVRLVVIGSACTPPGFVTIETEPCEGFRRPDEVSELMPARFRIDNLWGTHIRGDMWIREESDGGLDLPDNLVENWPYCHEKEFAETHRLYRVTAKNYPAAGMSCAIFEMPASKTVRIMGGSQLYGWIGDAAAGDCHYSFRMIRTEVLEKYEALVESE